MRVHVTVLVAAAALLYSGVHAGDDATTCVNECVKKYETPDTDTDTNSTISKAQCLAGCQFRAPPKENSMGFEMFAACRSRCKEEKEDAAPCHFACSLPYTSMVVMKYQYDGKSGQPPRLQIVRSSGGREAFGRLGQLLGLKDLGDEMKEDDDDWFEDEDDETEKDEKVDEKPEEQKTEKDIVAESEAMQRRLHEHFERLFSDFRRRFFNEDSFFKNVAVDRPHGHQDFKGLSMVGNTDDDGEQIIFAAPQDLEQFTREDQQQPQGGRRMVLEWEQRLRRFPALLQWAVCAVLLIAIAVTLAVTFLVMRQMKLNRYRVLHQPPMMGGGMGEAAPLPVKKTPLVEGEWEKAEGTPPPAYDQLSVHSLKKSSNQAGPSDQV